ncbi:MAG: hypothetical protein WC804_20495 [Sphingomonas sp.]|uniref:hypothetical protein n=1 Tax=Sphingomonas sp. TaxID=28214 RepID=UPI003563578C
MLLAHVSARNGAPFTTVDGTPGLSDAADAVLVLCAGEVQSAARRIASSVSERR